MIFVFGSNLSGIHGAGAAKVARIDYGAQLHVGTGPTGKAYAIPTKDRYIQTMPLDDIRPHVEDFIMYADAHPELVFKVTRIGCGLAGYKDEDIAPMFKHAPANCNFDSAWAPYLGNERHYWGHFA